MRGHAKGLIFKAQLSTGMAIVGLVTAMPASSQEATELKPVIIQAEGGTGNAEATGTSPVKGYVAKRSTTGSKSDTLLRQIPQSVSVIGSDEMQDRGVVNKVDEALTYTPGVNAQPFGNDGDTDWFYIRGFDATQTGVFMDGLNLFSYGFGGFQIDPFMLERVEVLKGPASVLYGGSNPGGIVNLVRKRPIDEPLFYTDIGINSNGNAFTGVDFSDKVGSSDTMTYRLTGKVAGGDNYSDFSHDLRGFIMPQLTLVPDDATMVNVWGYVGALDQVHTGNGFFPYEGTVADAPFGKIPRDAFLGEPDIDQGNYAQQMVGYELKHEFDSGWKITQSARYGHLRKHEIGPYGFGYINTTDPTNPNYYWLNRIGFEHKSTSDSYSMDNRAENEFDLGRSTHKVMVGIDYKYYRLDHVQAASAAMPIDPIDPVYGNPQPENSIYLNQVITQQQVGAYVQDQIHFGEGWLATLNGRYDYVDTQTRNGPTFWAPNQNFAYGYDKTAFSGRAGLAYEFANGVTPYVSIATFFNPIVATSLTRNIKPEEGNQIEAGIKYEPTFFDGTVSASLFELTKKNVVVTDPSTMLSSQLGEVRSRGFEFESKANLTDSWKAIAGFSYTDLEITEDANSALVGNTPYLQPKVQASLWLDYTVLRGVLEGLSVGGGVRYQGWSWADNENNKKVPGAAVFDAAIRYEKEDWGASINVTNLFDKEYVKGCGGLSTCGYGDARAITFKLSKKW
ncbi:TonB-dependent siderophore receptor [Rhizobium azibense]|nr:TonB-dependent siderophore receptor [Rhizobium azibense]